MSLKQKKNKHLKNKSNRRTTTAGKRGKRRLKHGVSKNSLKAKGKKRL